MAPQTELKEDTTTSNEKVDLSDRPLNYYPDQATDVEPQLRKLDLEWVAETARENVGVVAGAVLLGGAIGFLLKRRYLAASNLALVFLLQQVFFKQHRGSLHGNENRDRKEIEMERYALKAQRGDYGKMEVIPFR